MNRLAKTIMFALLLSVIPTRIWAQDYRDHENGFLFNVFSISNVEERVQLASALATSDIWLCNPTDNPGELFIRPNGYNEDIPIYAEFDYLRMTLREEYEAASIRTSRSIPHMGYTSGSQSPEYSLPKSRSARS